MTSGRFRLLAKFDKLLQEIDSRVTLNPRTKQEVRGILINGRGNIGILFRPCIRDPLWVRVILKSSEHRREWRRRLQRANLDVFESAVKLANNHMRETRIVRVRVLEEQFNPNRDLFRELFREYLKKPFGKYPTRK